jgi:peroxiredoxin
MTGSPQTPAPTRARGRFSTRMGIALLPVGSDAPPWKLPLATASAGTLSLRDQGGQIVVLDFWSTTCPPCLRQIEDLKVLWRRMKPRGVTVIGVSTGPESTAQIARFGRDRGIDYPLVVDRGEAATAYLVRSLPTLYVIGADGRIIAAHSGYWPLSDLAAALDLALAAHSSSQNSQPQK